MNWRETPRIYSGFFIIMNREIKFRVWEISEAEMIYSGNYYDKKQIHISKYEIGYGSDTIGFNNVSDRYKIMQYTGLKDKNGKEIYEGDIVKWKSGNHWNAFGGNPKEDRIDVVEYFEHGIKPFIFSEGYGGVEMINYRDCEIIGNIHENPELI